MTAGNLGRRGHAAAADEMAVTTRLLKRPSAAGTCAKPPKDEETNKEQLHGGTVKIHNPDALKLLYDLGLDDINTDEAPATDITRTHEEPAGNVTVANAELLLRLLSADDNEEPVISGPSSPAHARAAFAHGKGPSVRESNRSSRAEAATESRCRGPAQRRLSSAGGKFGRRLRLAQLASFDEEDDVMGDLRARRAHTR